MLILNNKDNIICYYLLVKYIYIYKLKIIVLIIISSILLNDYTTDKKIP